MIKTYNLTINVMIFLNLFIDFVHPFVKFLFLCIFLGSELLKKKEKKYLQPWSRDLSDWMAGKAQNACIWCNCIKIAVTYFVNFYLVKSLK